MKRLAQKEQLKDHIKSGCKLTKKKNFYPRIPKPQENSN